MIEGDMSIQKLKERFPQSVVEIGGSRGETVVVVRPADILPICQFLRSDADQAYELCLFVSAVDRLNLGL
jgi:NADH:ubiquinone oxidoreductase subunit C